MSLFSENPLADIGAFANPFGTPSKGQWSISKGVYTNSKGYQMVFFFETKSLDTPQALTAIDQTTDSGGRRLAVYEYPYKDGQAVADLGRKGETYAFNIKFFGQNYQKKFKDFIDNVVSDSGTATLTHPTLSAIRGNLKVRFKDYEVVHRYDEWNAVTIKATFIEDQTGAIKTQEIGSNPDSALRSALQTIVSAQASISQDISNVTALLLLPTAIKSAMSQRLSTITGQISRLLGQLAVTFSTNAQIQSLAAQAAQAGVAMLNVNSGTVQNAGSGTLSTLPPVYQVGFDTTTQSALASQVANFSSANQITQSQAVYFANSARAAISAAIAEVNTNFGNYGYDAVVNYRSMAIAIQQSVEASIASSQTQVVLYTVPISMSLRAIAFANGLTPDRQNDIEALNPTLGSVNLVPQGTVVTVPAA